MTAPARYRDPDADRLRTLLADAVASRVHAHGLTRRALSEQLPLHHSVLDRLYAGRGVDLDSVVALVRWCGYDLTFTPRPGADAAPAERPHRHNAKRWWRRRDCEDCHAVAKHRARTYSTERRELSRPPTPADRDRPAVAERRRRADVMDSQGAPRLDIARALGVTERTVTRYLAGLS